MSGNVWEWCWDQDGFFRRMRAGSWDNAPGDAAVAARPTRSLVFPDRRRDTYGFRLARSVTN